MAIERVSPTCKESIASTFGTKEVDKIPEWCLRIWQLAGEWEYKMHSDPNGIDRKHWPIVGMLAELNKKYEDEIKRLDERIAALEAKMAALSEDETEEVEQRRGPGRPRKEMVVA